MEQWYTLYTSPNAEHRVASSLEEREIEVYLPKVRRSEKNTRGKFIPFFHCYLFIHIDLDKTASSLWQWTPGLRYIVGFDGEPLPVPDLTITLIQHKLEELNKRLCQPQPQFKPGDIVRITNGPFAEMAALFEGPSKPSERVIVLLNFLGQISRVRLNAADLENASHLPSPTTTAPQKRPRRTRGHGRYIHTHTHADIQAVY
jgi:transcription antitermination factor NusG